MAKRGIESGRVRASGQTASSEEAVAEVEKMDDLTELDLPEERERTFRTPGFSRMRVEWSREDASVIERAHAAAEGMLVRNFLDAFELMGQVYDLVRTSEVDPETGEAKVDQYGFRIWKQTSSGSFEEDWSKMTLRQKEHFLFTITTRLFDWEQRAADVWMEAMFAKAKFEERFAIAFDAPMSGTVEDRRAKGNIDAREERYFAIFMSAYSRKVEALVRNLALLAQRLKDTMD